MISTSVSSASCQWVTSDCQSSLGSCASKRIQELFGRFCGWGVTKPHRLRIRQPGYRTIKGILAAGLERGSQDEQRVPSAPAFLHGPTTLFEEVPR